MIDLHTHTTLSDGELLPAELVRRAEMSGYQAIALTDHVDSGTIGIGFKAANQISRRFEFCKKRDIHKDTTGGGNNPRTAFFDSGISPGSKKAGSKDRGGAWRITG